MDGDGKAAVVIDLNQDAWPDVLVAQNNGPLKFFANQRSGETQKPLVLRLIGPNGNPDGIGARVSVIRGESKPLVQEVYGGSGYLGQSTARLFFALPDGSSEVTVEILWPDGLQSQTRLKDPKEDLVSIRYPR